MEKDLLGSVQTTRETICSTHTSLKTVCVCEAGLHDRSGFNRTSAQSLHTPLIVVIFHNLINLVGKKNVRKRDVFKLFKDSSSRRNDKKRQQTFTLKKQKLASFLDYWFTDVCMRRTCCSLLRMNDSEKDARAKMFLQCRFECDRLVLITWFCLAVTCPELFCSQTQTPNKMFALVRFCKPLTAMVWLLPGKRPSGEFPVMFMAWQIWRT